MESKVMKFKIPASLLKAAQRFQAVQDPRWYLGGIHVSPCGTVRASDGRMLIDGYVGEPIKGLKKAVIIRISGKAIPKKAKFANIVIDDIERLGYCTFTDQKDQPVKMHEFLEMRSVELIKYKPVDFERVINTQSPREVNTIGVNFKYLSVVEKALLDMGNNTECAMEFFSPDSQIHIKPLRWKEDAFSVKFIVMPTRV
jgi:hypothetical protein